MSDRQVKDLPGQWEQRAKNLNSFTDDVAKTAITYLRMCARELRETLKVESVPAVPHNGTDTSKAAAATVDQGSWHDQIMALFTKAGSINGYTCGQIEMLLPHGTHQGISARVRELVLARRLVDSGHRRKNPQTGRSARVYIATGK